MVRSAALTAPLFGLRREIDRLFEDSFGNAATPSLATSAWWPAVDVRETPEAVLFELELPGVAENKLDITCESNVLTIAGEKEGMRKETEGKFHIVERNYGAFRRAFQLPANVQEDKIAATMKNGVLTVTVPKMEQPKPRRVPITT